MPRVSRHRVPTGTGVNDLILRDVRNGFINCVYDIELIAGTTETLVRDANIGSTTRVAFCPYGPGLAALDPYLFSITRGELIIRHAAPSTATTVGLLLLG